MLLFENAPWNRMDLNKGTVTLSTWPKEVTEYNLDHLAQWQPTLATVVKDQ